MEKVVVLYTLRDVEFILVEVPVVVKSAEIVVGPYIRDVPVVVKLLVLIKVLAVKDSTSKLESKFTYKYPLNDILSYDESVTGVSLITT